MSERDESSLDVFVGQAEDVCAREPIQQPGAIQGHGVLVLLGAGGEVVSHSANVARYCPGLRRDRPFSWLPPPVQACVAGLGEGEDATVLADLPDGIGRRHVHCFVTGGMVGIEFEVAEPPFPENRALALPLTVAAEVRAFAALPALDGLGQRLVEVIRRETGFERVLLYRFDEDDHGDVVAESLDPGWTQSLLGLRFPASDIPAQARALYRRVRQRWTPRREYEPVALQPSLHPLDGQPFDIGLSAFRAVSPVHTLYQRNLGVDGAMALSVLQDGRLWGLVVGHSRGPQPVPVPVRVAVGQLVEAFALRLGTLMVAGEIASFADRMDSLTGYLSKLAGEESFVEALLQPPLVVGEMFDGCSGVAILHRVAGHGIAVRLAGDTPPAADIRRLMDWLRVTSTDMVVETDCISALYPAFASHCGTASGVLAAFLCDERDQAILWFRPEVVREIAWGGRPEKIADAANGLYLPRRSFDRWVETRHGHSCKWLRAEIHAARVFGTAVSKLIIRQRRRIDALNAEVERFLWVTSHHLRESPRRIAIGCDLLRHTMGEGFAPIADLVADIKANAVGMDSRLRGLIAYSEVGHDTAPPVPVALAECLEVACRRLQAQIADAGAVLRVLGELPVVMGERQALVSVLENLLENALAFRAAGVVPDIRLWAERSDECWQVSVADNGIGIDGPYVERVFGLFEILGTAGTLRGIGVGLTLCRRIVERLDGRIWLESQPGHGTTVHLLLPAAAERGAAGQDAAPSRTMVLLRNATHDLHEALSHTVLMRPLAEGRLSVGQYRQALAALYGFYRPAETMLFSRYAAQAAALGAKPKLPALIADLTALGLSRDEVMALPCCAAVAAPADSDAALGLIYVLEGATLGGQVVLRRVAHCLGPLAGVATSFHNFHGAATGEHWCRFQAALSARAGSPGAQQSVIGMAVATFAALLDWVERPVAAEPP